MPGTKRCLPPPFAPQGPFPGRLPAPHPPLPHPAPPVIPGDTEELVEEVTVNASSTVSLQCPALGNPTPTISWLQNGLPFSPSPRLQVLEDGQVLQVRASPAVDKAAAAQAQCCWPGTRSCRYLSQMRSLPESLRELPGFIQPPPDACPPPPCASRAGTGERSTWEFC